jgi:hypothetical protein
MSLAACAWVSAPSRCVRFWIAMMKAMPGYSKSAFWTVAASSFVAR